MGNYSANDDLILAALKAGDALTPAVAAQRWGCLALHSAIARLRKAGHKISTRMIDGHGEYRIIASDGKAAARESVSAAQSTTPRVVPASAAPYPLASCADPWEAGQYRRSFGRIVYVVAAGFSAYDGTAFAETRDLGPA